MSPRTSSGQLFVCLLVGFCLGLAVAIDRNSGERQDSPVGWRGRSDASAPKKSPARQIAASAPATTSGLGSDNPEIRRKLDDFVEQTDRRLAAIKKPEYAALFARLGLPSAVGEDIIRQEALVRRAKIKANLAQGEFAQVQADYDQRVQKLLGERFPEYLAYEKETPVREELGSFLHFARASQIPLTGNDKTAVEKILGELGPSLKSSVEWGGPYQGIPKVYAGKDVLPVFTAEYADFSRRLTHITEQGRKYELSEPAAFALSTFYQNHLKSTKDLMDRAQDPLALRRSRLADNLAALKASTDPNSREIKHVQMLLDAAEAGAIR